MYILLIVYYIMCMNCVRARGRDGAVAAGGGGRDGGRGVGGRPGRCAVSRRRTRCLTWGEMRRSGETIRDETGSGSHISRSPSTSRSVVVKTRRKTHPTLGATWAVPTQRVRSVSAVRVGGVFARTCAELRRESQEPKTLRPYWRPHQQDTSEHGRQECNHICSLQINGVRSFV